MPFVAMPQQITEPDKDGRRHFTLQYLGTDFNAAVVYLTDMAENPVFKAAKKMVHFSIVTLIFTGALGTTFTLSFDWLGGSNYLGSWISAIASDTTGQVPVDLTLPITTLRTAATYWFEVGVEGYAATDDMAILFTGWIE